MAYDFLGALGVIEGTFGRVWGCLGQAWGLWGRLWTHLNAFWMRLGGILTGFGGVSRLSGRVLDGLEGVWRWPKQAQASFGEGLGWFLPGFLAFFPCLKPKAKMSQNIDFP